MHVCGAVHSSGNSLLALSLCCLAFRLTGYFQQPQGEMVTDASRLCPQVRRACGAGATCTAQHLAVAMETAAGRWTSFEFDYSRTRCTEKFTAPTGGISCVQCYGNVVW